MLISHPMKRWGACKAPHHFYFEELSSNVLTFRCKSLAESFCVQKREQNRSVEALPVHGGLHCVDNMIYNFYIFNRRVGQA